MVYGRQSLGSVVAAPPKSRKLFFEIHYLYKPVVTEWPEAAFISEVFYQ